MQPNLNYILEEIIGEGAMAIVYKARHRELDSHHAIKKLKIQDFDIQKRLIQEGKLLANIRHPNILSVTDLVKLDGTPSLVMEYIQGPSLADMLSRFDINEKQTDALGRGIMKGVMAAHKQGLIHRDLKPGNILIDIVDGVVVPKVADFGLAKILHSSQPILPQTRSGVTMGTPAYMAPEQIKHFGSVDERADIFSLGIILYEVVTGKGCFTGVNTMEIWEHICNGKYVLPEKIKSSIPARMKRTIEKALIVDRKKRFSSVEEMLDCWCTDEENEYVPLLSKDERNFWPKELLERIISDAAEKSPEEDETLDFSAQVDIAPLINMAQELDHIRSQKSTSPSLSMYKTIQDESSVIPNTKQITKGLLGVFTVCIFALGVVFWYAPKETNEPVQQQNLERTENDHDFIEHSLLNPFEGTSKPYFLFEQARDQLLRGEYYHACSSLQKLPKNDQNHASVFALKGLGMFLRGNVHEARLFVKKAKVLSTNEGTLYPSVYQLDEVPLNDTSLEKDPIVLLLVVLSKWFDQDQNLVDELVSYQKFHPKSSAFFHLELQRYRENGDWTSYEKKFQQIHQSSPSALQLEYALRQSMVNPKEVEDRLMLLQKKDAGNVDLQLHLANFFAMQGDEHRRTQQFMMALSDTVSQKEQMRFLSKHAKFLAGIGRILEAEKLWNFCLDDFDALDVVQPRVQCAVDALEHLQTINPTGNHKRWIDSVSREMSSPYLLSESKIYYSLMLYTEKAKEAIRSNDLDGLQIIKKEIMDLSEQKQVLPILRMIELQKVKRVDNLEDQQKYIQKNYKSSTPVCSDLMVAASIAEISNLHEQAQHWRETFLKRRCVLQFPNLFTHKAQIHLELARSFAQQSEVELAKEHLSQFFRLWSTADEHLPSVQKAQKLSDSLEL